MKFRLAKSGFAAALLCSALISGGVSAHQETPFSALEGIEAQALSAQEMDAIHGAATATQILTTFRAAIDRLVAANPRLAATAAVILARFQTTLDRLVARGVLQP